METNKAKLIIRKAAVLGAGVMGSQIALHLANCGLDVELLDIELPQGTGAFNTQKALAQTLKLQPNPAFYPGIENHIRCGSLTSNLSRLKECDWIVEAVIEDLAIKQNLYQQLEEIVKTGTIISSNTSSLPMALLCQGRTDAFKKNFFGTHFFNPPRYLPLLEIIPGPETDIDLINRFLPFARKNLGKTTILCKDTPGFIANRIGVFAIAETIQLTEELNLSFTQIDAITGVLMGRPKSATFRTADVVGVDTLFKVALLLSQNLPSDPFAKRFVLPQWVQAMVDKGFWGEKKGSGFFKKVKDATGQNQIWTLNRQTLSYELEAVYKISGYDKLIALPLPERIEALMQLDGKIGDFIRRFWAALWAYSAYCIPEITDNLEYLDDALKSGFGWVMGPFELWQAIGLDKVNECIINNGYPLPNFVLEAQKREGFFKKTELGEIEVYFPVKNQYQNSASKAGLILLDAKRKTTTIWKNDGSSLHHLGKGILCFEFHSKLNTLGGEVIAGLNNAFDVAEREFEALIIGNQGGQFSAGANLALVLSMALEEEWDELDLMIRQFQKTMSRARFSGIPVVVAPFGLCLGGGTELSLHADALQLAAETYMGLVETGVGLIPGGGGTKETALRLSEEAHLQDAFNNRLQEAFTQLALAKVSSSGPEARKMGFANTASAISLNKDRQLADAFTLALALAERGYQPPRPNKQIKVTGRAGLANLQVMTATMVKANYASAYDKKVCDKLAYVLCGGDLTALSLVSEQYLLDLEREAFLSLCGEIKTKERIQYTLKTGKPLRN